MSHPKRRSPRGILTVLGALTAALLLALAFEERVQLALLEKWYLHRLSVTEGREREDAAAALSGVCTERAIPRLVEIAREDRRHSRPCGKVLEQLLRLGPGGARAAFESFRESNGQVSRHILQAVRRLRSQAREALPLLQEMLSAADTADDVVYALAALGSPAVPVALDALITGQPSTRSAAAKLLNHLDDLPMEALEPLLEAACDSDKGVRSRAVTALAKLGSRAVPALAPLFTPFWNANNQLYEDVVRGWRPPPGFESLVLAEVLPALQDESAEVRLRALLIARCYARSSEPAEEAVLRALSDPEPAVRAAAVYYFCFEAAPDTVTAAPQLFDLLSDTNAGVRCMAAGALAKRGLAGKELVPVLLQGIDDHGDIASSALRTIGPFPSEHLAALDRLLADPRQGVRLTALKILGSVEADEAVPRISRALDDEDLGIVETAIEQLRAKARDDSRLLPRVIPAFVRLLELNRSCYWTALESQRQPFEELRRIGSLAVPALLTGLASNRPFVREQSALCLARIGKPLEKILPALLDLAEYLDPEARAAALEGLKLLAPKAPSAAGALRRALLDCKPSIRLSAAMGLWTVLRESASTAPVLIDLLEVQDRRLRIDAILVLSKMGREANAAVPALKEIARSDEEMKDLVAKAIEAIRR